MNRILLVVVCIAQAVVGNAVGAVDAAGANADNADKARLPLRGVRRRRGRLPDVSAARRGRVPRLPLLICCCPVIIIIKSSALRGPIV